MSAGGAGTRRAVGVNGLLRAIDEDDMLRECIAYDTLACAPVVLGELPWDESRERRAWTDADDAALYAHMQDAVGRVSRADVQDALTIRLAQHRVDPLRDWLRGLPAWDGARRMDTLLHDYLGCADSRYVRAVTWVLMLGAVARAMEPGRKFDYMPVLVGPQGCGKSTLCRLLPVNGDWYLDGPSDFADVRGMAEQTRGRWICEVSELAAMRKREVEAVKGAITRQVDVFREPYARRASEWPRRFVMVGTTNERGFLRDRTGARRFLPVECAVTAPALDVHDERAARAHITMCWAEAVACWDERHGDVPLVLDAATEADADAAREAAAEADGLAETVASWLVGRTRTCVKQVAVECLGMDAAGYARDKLMQREIASVLDNSCPGWARHRGNAKGKGSVLGYGVVTCWDKDGT